MRDVSKPVGGSVRIAVAGVEVPPSGFTVDTTTGLVLFSPEHVPAVGAGVSAGFLFDTPARFDADYLEIDLTSFEAGEIPDIPLVEIIH